MKPSPDNREPRMERLDELQCGPFPYHDGWGWLYRLFERVGPPGGRWRRAVCRYFHPCVIERWRRGSVYRILGVHLFGALIPTGGIVVRRVTGARMAPYTLAGHSLAAARAFYYRTCVFEALHLPFLLTMIGLAIHRAMIGRPDMALENMAINLVANVYPVMHHRRTRARIADLLDRARRRRPRLDTRSVRTMRR